LKLTLKQCLHLWNWNHPSLWIFYIIWILFHIALSYWAPSRVLICKKLENFWRFWFVINSGTICFLFMIIGIGFQWLVVSCYWKSWWWNLWWGNQHKGLEINNKTIHIKMLGTHNRVTHTQKNHWVSKWGGSTQRRFC